MNSQRPNELRPFKVVIIYMVEERPNEKVGDLYKQLQACGIEVFMFSKDMPVVENHAVEMEERIKNADSVIICYSENFEKGRGYRHQEVEIALEEQRKRPPGNAYLIPVLLDKCNVPPYLSSARILDYFGRDYFDKIMHLGLKVQRNKLIKQGEKIQEFDYHLTQREYVAEETKFKGDVLLPTSRVGSSGVWNVPHKRNLHFTGRDELLDQLDQRLTPSGQNNSGLRNLLRMWSETITVCLVSLLQGSGLGSRKVKQPNREIHNFFRIANNSAKIGRVALTQPQAIKGLGGIGKTQIAVEFAYRSRDLDRYTHTFWVNAASEETIITSFVAIADLLPLLAAHRETDQRELVEAVKRWLERCQQRWLLIFDNADDVSLVRDYLPQQGNGNGSILLTTRAHAVGSLATSVEVETMGFLESTQLLLRRARRIEHASDEEINQAGNIAVALDHFPLALDQAGAYIEETQCSFVDYLDLYRTHRQALLAQPGIPSTDYPYSVATTWSLSFQKIEQANPAAVELLHLCSFLAPDRIPEELLRDGAAYWPASLQQAAADLFTFNQMIAELLKFSLVKRLAEDHVLSIHRLVQVVQRDRMDSEMQRQWAERVVRGVETVFPSNIEDTALWSQCRRYLDQVQACRGLINEYTLLPIEAAHLLYRTSRYLYNQALYAIAVDLEKQALEISERQSEPQYILIASCLDGLGTLYHAQGYYKRAEALFQRALQTYKQQQNLLDSNYLLICNNLASLYQDQGNYQSAEMLYRRTLTVFEEIKGKSHLDTANACNSLATLLLEQAPHDQRRYKEAETLFERCLEIYERQLEPQYLYIARVLNNLGSLYLSQGYYEKAELPLRRSLRIYERQLDPQHPLILDTQRNLAILIAYQNNPQQAQLFLQSILAIQEQTLGPEHPNSAILLTDIALLCEGRGDCTQAQIFYQRSLAICLRKLGENHDLTEKNRRGLARLQNC